MTAVLHLSSLEAPVVQAGMGFIAGHALAAAVSEAGGLGTIAGPDDVRAADIRPAAELVRSLTP